ncbi:hypothetical protein SUDANB145_03437 [Streptomyces sp. enrichment culture]|uniref:ATP-binding protein n=1 Tax=Streptomyces sp. enrichment culture TaxID=1795815 RepID=UPI003F57E400
MVRGRGERELRPFIAHFPSSPRTARLARRHAVRWLEERGYPPASDVSCTVALVVGELVANAVQHGRVPGRGLLLVDALAVRWGSAPRRPVGKTVWAELSLSSQLATR